MICKVIEIRKSKTYKEVEYFVTSQAKEVRMIIKGENF